MNTQDRKTILLVEDIPASAMIVTKQLEKLQYHTITVNDGEAAVRLAAENPAISLILMDIMLGGGIDGTEAAKQILVLRNIPIVFLTAHSEQEIVEKVRGLTRYGYVLKNSADHIFASSIEMAFELFDAHEKSRASEERYQRIIDGLTDYIYTVRMQDGQPAETIHTAACVGVTGYSAEEYAADPYLWLRMVMEEDRDRVIDRLKNVLTDKNVPPIEHRIVRKDGQVRWVRDIIIPHVGPQGNLISYDGIVKDITERIQADKKLQESDAKHASMVSNISDVIGIIGIDGIMKYKSPNIEKWFGWQPDDLIGTDGWLTVHPDDLERIQNEFFTLLKNDNSSVTVEYRYKCKDGSYKPIELTAINLVNDPMINGVLMNYHDITERKRTDIFRRESEAKLKKAQSQAHMGSWTWNIKANHLDWSDEMFRIFGLERETFTGSLESVVAQAIHPDDRAKVNESNLSVIKDHQPIPLDYRIVWPDKSVHIVWAEAGELLVDESGEPSILSGTVQDITERKLAEDKIRESDLQFRKLSANVPDLIYQFTRRTDGTYYVPIASVGIKNIFGCSPEDVLEDFTPIGRVIYPEDAARVISDIEYSAEHLTVFTCEFRVQIPGKSLQWIYSRSTPERLADGSITWYGFNTDITQRKLAEEKLRNIETRLRQTEKMDAIGQLAGGIAHDFNNVLGGILGFTDISLALVEKGSILESNLNKVLKATDRAKNLVKQILAFSRQGNPQKVVTTIRPIINEVLDLLRSSIPSSVIIESDLHEDTQPVLADPTQIHQVLLNLATNAVHAMNRHGKLTVKLHTAMLDNREHGISGEIAPGQYTVIEFSDTGCGMDAKTRAKAFEPFFTTKPVGEGTGMGLSVVLGIVQSHGGDLQVESEVGKGTTIRIFLPATEESSSDAPADHVQTSLNGTERILFVDDEEILVDMNLNLLTSLGYTVTATTKSVDALQVIREKIGDIDILITDQTMPGITGIELAKEALRMRKDLPIILCTGFSNDVDRESAMAMGFSKFITKPYRPHEISKAIRDVLDNKKQEDLGD